MPRSHVLSALFAVVLAISGFVYTIAVGNEPLLGLDLQGGVSVVYQPTGPADEESLDQSVEIIRSRVDALGVAEPEISRQGQTIVVDLPGVEEQQRALELVGQTAELRFRPVLIDFGPVDPSLLDPSTPATDTTDTTDTTAPETSDTTTGETEEESLAPIRRRQDTTETTETTEPTEPATTDTTEPLLDATTLAIQTACGTGEFTTPEADVATSYVLLQSREGSALCLGPSLLIGDALETSEVGFDGLQWSVNPVFKSGDAGIDRFNAVAQLCFNQTEVCPSGRLAIVLDHQSISAPTINAASFERDRIQISGSFEEDEARDLNTALRFGALPVELEAQATRTVSATIGDDVLKSGATAGIIGLALVAIYLLAFYRLSGLVAIGGLVVSGLMLWTIIAWFGANQGLAISLAGVVGLIVAIGVSADSNIVYFENVKDSIRDGRRVPTAVERAYRTSISTIVKADVVSLIAAVLLYFLTVGAVRGFAFYLGVATLLDLFVSYTFMRPALLFLANLGVVKKNPRLLGLNTGDAS